MPLAYTLNSISNGQVIGIRSVGDFEEAEECSVNSYDVDVNFNGFTVNKVVEGRTDTEDDIFGRVTLKNYKVGTQNPITIERVLFAKDDNQAISKKANQTYEAAENPYSFIKNMGSEKLLQTILNFSQTIKDLEALYKPEYKPLSERDLQYSFGNATTLIERLAVGQKTDIIKRIKLYENGDENSAALTLNIKITVTRK